MAPRNNALWKEAFWHSYCRKQGATRYGTVQTRCQYRTRKLEARVSNVFPRRRLLVATWGDFGLRIVVGAAKYRVVHFSIVCGHEIQLVSQILKDNFYYIVAITREAVSVVCSTRSCRLWCSACCLWNKEEVCEFSNSLWSKFWRGGFNDFWCFCNVPSGDQRSRTTHTCT